MTDDSSSDLRERVGPRSVEEMVFEAVRAAMGATKARPVAEVIEAYLSDLSGRVGASHAKKSAQQLRRIALACPAPSVGEVFLYRSARLRDGASRRTVEMEVGALRACLRWARRGGLLPSDPLEELPHVAIREGDRRRLPRSFDEAELCAFFSAAGARWGVPQAPNWALLAATGLRWSEAAQLTRAHLDGDRLVLPAGFTKAKRARAVLLPEDLARYFRRISGPLLLAPGGRPWLAVGHRGAHALFRRTLKAAGLDHRNAEGRLLTIHSFRRTAATFWARDGVPILAISRLLGHANSAFTERWYLDTTVEDALGHQRAALEKIAAREKKTAETAASVAGPVPRRCDEGSDSLTGAVASARSSDPSAASALTCTTLGPSREAGC